MKKHNLSTELRELVSTTDDLCVSMIIPMNEQPSMKKMDKITLDHAIAKLQSLMESSYEPALVKEFIARLRSSHDGLIRIAGVKGLGIFISKSLVKTITFPFEVKEKIHIGKTFEVRDVLYRDNYYSPYHVLSLTLSRVRLFKGSGPSLIEVEDANFPAIFSEPEAEISESFLSSTNMAAATQREKTLTMESPHAFLNGVDKKLGMYLHNNHEPLLLAGVEKEIAAFESSTVHRSSIRGKIHGSYNGYNLNELQQKCWDCICQHKNNEQERIIGSMNELFGRELVSIGLQDVWRNAKLGKGNILVVEKDFEQAAYVTPDGFQVWLSQPDDKHLLLSDAIDDVIETVLNMDGKVQFVDNGKLREFNGVAMIHRY